MVSAEIAFRSDTPLKALILLSPTVIDEPSWRDGIPLRRGLPVFIAHGRQDEVLPFSTSARLAETLRTAGLKVTWVPFDGPTTSLGPSSTPSTTSSPPSTAELDSARTGPDGTDRPFASSSATNVISLRHHMARPHPGRLPGRAGMVQEMKVDDPRA